MTTLGEHIRRLEEKLLRPEIRQSEAALAALLAEEFVEFASDGATYTKAQVIAALQREAPFVRSLPVWTERNGRWQLLFHQGTRVVP